MASIVEFIPEADYERYNELLGIAEANKAAAPKVKRTRAAMTPEQKLKNAQTRRDKAEARLNEILAAEGLLNE